MVQEASGAVVLVGGFLSTTAGDDIFRLSHAQTEWHELPQRLTHRRENHVAFLVPDTYTKCVPAL